MRTFHFRSLLLFLLNIDNFYRDSKTYPVGFISFTITHDKDKDL